MPQTSHSLRTRNSICAAVSTDTNSGTGTAAGRLRIENSSNVLLVEFILSNPAFGTPTGGSMTLNNAAAGTPVASGTAAWARFIDRDGGLVVQTDVTGSGGTGGVTSLPTTTITTGVPVALTGTPVTYSAPL